MLKCFLAVCILLISIGCEPDKFTKDSDFVTVIDKIYVMRGAKRVTMRKERAYVCKNKNGELKTILPHITPNGRDKINIGEIWRIESVDGREAYNFIKKK